MEDINDLRRKVELGGEVKLVVTNYHQGYNKVVYSVVEFSNGFYLYRYFKSENYFKGEKWNYSCDALSKDIKDCLDEITDAFKDSYPEK
jgi:hypothetical protein